VDQTAGRWPDREGVEGAYAEIVRRRCARLRVTAKKWSRGVKLQINKKAGENALREAQDEPALQKRGREKPGLAKVD